MKQVSVLVGAGSIGQAIIRRVSAGKHIVLADYSIENAQRAARTLEDAGFECSTIQCDLGSKEDILKLVEFATNKGEVTNLVNAAGVSPSQAPVAEILRVDLYRTFLGMTAIIMQAKTDKEQLTNEARAEGKLACTMPCKEKEDESQMILC